MYAYTNTAIRGTDKVNKLIKEVRGVAKEGGWRRWEGWRRGVGKKWSSEKNGVARDLCHPDREKEREIEREEERAKEREKERERECVRVRESESERERERRREREREREREMAGIIHINLS